MTHKFDPAQRAKLDNEWRRQNLPPIQTLEELGLLPSDVVADIGCGIGYFSVPAAGLLNERNKVFALDTSDEMLAEVEKRAEIDEATNLVTIRTEEYDFKLPDETVTFGLLVNVLHEIEDKRHFIAETKRILKPGGRLALVEWIKKESEMGPEAAHRISQEEATELFRSQGFQQVKETQFAETFYGCVFQKNL